MPSTGRGATSTALREFRSALAIVDALIRLDRRIQGSSPAPPDLLAAEGMRGGSAVLMVAAFEQYLKSAFEEHLTRLASPTTAVPLSSLPVTMRAHCVWQALTNVMRSEVQLSDNRRLVLLPELTKTIQLLASERLDPTVFAATGGNPSSERVKRMFKAVDVPNVFASIKHPYEVRTRTPVADRFITDKLDEIVNRRHVVAHTAATLNLSTVELADSVEFLGHLGACLDDVLDGVVKAVIQPKKRRRPAPGTLQTQTATGSAI